jgi:hypothetical protein
MDFATFNRNLLSITYLVKTVNEAHRIGLVTIGFLGMDGGMLKGLVDASIVVPSDDYGLIETVHVALDHLLVDYFKKLQVKSETYQQYFLTETLTLTEINRN